MDAANHKYSLPRKFNWLKFIWQTIFWLILAYFAYILLFAKTSFFLLDNFELLLHEAGHFLFSLFGDFIMTLGGITGQIILPIVFIIYFFYSSQFYSGSIMLFWFGQNLVNISYYIQDARAMKLELIGDIHDWNYLLGKFNLLGKDIIIGKYIFGIGVFFITVALLICLYSLIKEYRFRNK